MLILYIYGQLLCRLHIFDNVQNTVMNCRHVTNQLFSTILGPFSKEVSLISTKSLFYLNLKGTLSFKHIKIFMEPKKF